MVKLRCFGDDDMNKDLIKYAFMQTLPIMAGYLVLGMGFGILLYDHGYSVLWAILMSITIYAGSMQYVAIDLISSGASILTTLLMTLMVNARHLFYGISMVDKYKDTKPYKPYLIYALTDETYSLVCDAHIPERMDINKYYFLVSLFDQCYWVIGSVLGSLIGSAFSFDTTGVDFSMTALFVVIFVEQWESADNHIPASIGILVSVICLIVFGADSFLIPTMIIITIVLFLLKNRILGGKKV